MAEYIFEIDGAFFNEDTGEAVMKPEHRGKLVRCKDCKHQEKYFYADKRLKDGGRYTYGCDLADGYSHVCLDDDFCSRGERKDE